MGREVGVVLGLVVAVVGVVLLRRVAGVGARTEPEPHPLVAVRVGKVLGLIVGAVGDVGVVHGRGVAADVHVLGSIGREVGVELGNVMLPVVLLVVPVLLVSSWGSLYCLWCCFRCCQWRSWCVAPLHRVRH